MPMDADAIDWEWQAMCLRQRLTEVDGDAFESLFQEIGKALWGRGFQATIPMGSRGDLKCDGWRADVGYLYQCYGPRYGQANVADALKKVDEDFRGAKEGWQAIRQDHVPPPAAARKSDSVRHFFTISTAAADHVRRYIRDHAEPDEAARMAEGFAARYRMLRDTGAEPAEACRDMLIFAGGAHGDPDRDVAALAIITHFFATCREAC
jgi:hypothetical protein